VYRELCLKVTDPLVRGCQCRLLRRAHAGNQSTVNAVLPAPVVNRLIADPEIMSDLRDRANGLDQMRHPTTELDRISTSSHAVLLEDNNPTNPEIRLHETQGRPEPPTNPGRFTLMPSASVEYDLAGLPKRMIDEANGVTDVTRDSFGEVVQILGPPRSDGSRPATVRELDDGGRVTATVDPVGARIEFDYDQLDRLVGNTQVVRRPNNATSQRLVSVAAFDDAGNVIAMRDAAGNENKARFNKAGETVALIDPLEKETLIDRDPAGRPIRVTDPLGRVTESGFDVAGRQVTSTVIDRYPAPGGLSRLTTSWRYDLAGNVVEKRSPNGEAGGSALGWVSTFEYDSNSRLVAVTEPTSPTHSVTSRYRYNAGGQLTSLIDGRSLLTRFTYNSWGARESVIEPSTSQSLTESERTWTTAFDQRGLPVRETQPDGITISRVFDEQGNMITENGESTNPAIPAAERIFGYDLAGRLTTIGHPDGGVTFGYDDRGLRVSQSGGAGAATWGYDEGGRLSTRTDVTGTATFTWTKRNQLKTMFDPLTAITLTRSYDDAGQPDVDSFSNGVQRDYAFDDLSRLAGDTVTKPDNTLAQRTSYGYDPDGLVVSRRVEGQSGAPTLETFGYDWSRRLVARSFATLDASGAVSAQTSSAYGWDDSGNRTSVDGVTSLFNERNQLLSSSDGRTYTWSYRGTLDVSTQGGATTADVFDALGRRTSNTTTTTGSVSTTFVYDSLDRLSTRTAGETVLGFTYVGTSLDPISIGTEQISRNPSGELFSNKQLAGAGQLGGAGGLLFTNTHGDVTLRLDTAGTASSTRFDPFGKSVAPLGGTQLGFQGDFTDPVTGEVWMGARSYQPETGGFTSRDRVTGNPARSISLNRYTYGFGSPTNYNDPDGRWPSLAGLAGCAANLKGCAKNAVKTVVTAAGRCAQNLASCGAKVGKAVNKHVIQPAARGAKDLYNKVLVPAAKAARREALAFAVNPSGYIKTRATQLAIASERAARSAKKWAEEHKEQLQAAAAAVAVTGLCIVGTVGIGTAACIGAGVTTFSAVNAAQTCDSLVSLDCADKVFKATVFDYEQCKTVSFSCAVEVAGILPLGKIAGLAGIAGAGKTLDKLVDLKRSTSSVVNGLRRTSKAGQHLDDAAEATTTLNRNRTALKRFADTHPTGSQTGAIPMPLGRNKPPTKTATNTSPTYGQLRGQPDAHHIIQDAAVRDVPGYSRSAAPAVRLDGPSTTPGTPHYNATQAQSSATVGGTYGAERQVGACALAAAGCSPAVISDALERADNYFMGELDLTMDSPLRIPGNRRRVG
jgi:RHS repeat-associated protein